MHPDGVTDWIDEIIRVNRSERMKRRPKSMRVTVEFCDVDFEVHELPGFDLTGTLTAECTVYDDGEVVATRDCVVSIYDDDFELPERTMRCLLGAFHFAILRAITKAAGGHEAIAEKARQERDRQWHAMQQDAALEKRETVP